MRMNWCSLRAVWSRHRQIAVKWLSFLALLNCNMFLRPNSLGKHYDFLRSPNFMLQYKRPKGEDFKWMKWRNLHFPLWRQFIGFGQTSSALSVSRWLLLPASPSMLTWPDGEMPVSNWRGLRVCCPSTLSHHSWSSTHKYLPSLHPVLHATCRRHRRQSVPGCRRDGLSPAVKTRVIRSSCLRAQKDHHVQLGLCSRMHL